MSGVSTEEFVAGLLIVSEFSVARAAVRVSRFYTYETKCNNSTMTNNFEVACLV